MKSVFLLLGFLSVQSFADAGNLPGACRIKCSDPHQLVMMASRYINGRIAGGAEFVDTSTFGAQMMLFAATRSDIAPGVYTMDSPEIESLDVDVLACGYYLNTVTAEGDFVETLIPGTIRKDRRPLSSALYLENVKVKNLHGNLQSVFAKMPRFKSRDDIKREMAPQLEVLREEGLCK